MKVNHFISTFSSTILPVLFLIMFSTAGAVRRLQSLGSRSFDKIVVQGVIDVKLTQSNEHQVEIEATQDSHQYIKVDVSDDHVLSIRTEQGFCSSAKAVAHVKINGLNSYTLNNVVGTTESTNIIEQNGKFSLHVNHGTANVALKLNALTFDAIISGTSNCTLEGKVTNEASIKSEGVFNIDASSFITSKMNVDANGVGKVYVHAIERINALASGMAQIFYQGPLGTVQQNGMARVSPAH